MPPAEESWPASDELQALGRVIQAASTFEHELGQAFCTLVGSKYATVLIGSKTSRQLIDDCRALTKVQSELSEPARAAIATVLNRCADANSKRNRLVHDMWAFNPGGVSQQLQRERGGYNLVSRPVTLDEINAIAGDLTHSAIELNSILLDHFSPERYGLEAQLRWDDAVAQMTTEDQTKLLHQRLAGMLGEISRLLARYREESWAKWAEQTAQTVKSDSKRGLQVITDTYEKGDLSSLMLSGEPSNPGPVWLREQDPNVQLATIREQIWQLTNFLLTPLTTNESDPVST